MTNVIKEKKYMGSKKPQVIAMYRENDFYKNAMQNPEELGFDRTIIFSRTKNLEELAKEVPQVVYSIPKKSLVITDMTCFNSYKKNTTYEQRKDKEVEVYGGLDDAKTGSMNGFVNFSMKNKEEDLENLIIDISKVLNLAIKAKNPEEVYLFPQNLEDHLFYSARGPYSEKCRFRYPIDCMKESLKMVSYQGKIHIDKGEISKEEFQKFLNENENRNILAVADNHFSNKLNKEYKNLLQISCFEQDLYKFGADLTSIQGFREKYRNKIIQIIKSFKKSS